VVEGNEGYYICQGSTRNGARFKGAGLLITEGKSNLMNILIRKIRRFYTCM